MEDNREPRIEHLRLLLFKQVKIMDSQGGIALRALNARVTYVNIIQVCEHKLPITMGLHNLTTIYSV